MVLKLTTDKYAEKMNPRENFDVKLLLPACLPGKLTSCEEFCVITPFTMLYCGSLRSRSLAELERRTY